MPVPRGGNLLNHYLVTLSATFGFRAYSKIWIISEDSKFTVRDWSCYALAIAIGLKLRSGGEQSPLLDGLYGRFSGSGRERLSEESDGPALATTVASAGERVWQMPIGPLPNCAVGILDTIDY
jgi:hypothetical protein